MKAVIFALAGLILWHPASAHADDALVDATSFKPLSAPADIAVQPWDNSAENMRLAADIETELRIAGYTVSKSAPVVLSFEIKNVLGSQGAGGRRHFLEIEGRGTEHGRDEAKVRLNLFSSESGGVLNKGRGGESAEPTRYILEATVDRKSGPRLWQGQASAAYTKGQPELLVKNLVPILIRQLGKTVRGKTFKLP